MMRGRQRREHLSTDTGESRSRRHTQRDEPLHLLCNEERLRGTAWANSSPGRGHCYAPPVTFQTDEVEEEGKKDEQSTRLNASPALYPLNDGAHSQQQLTFKDRNRHLKWKFEED